MENEPVIEFDRNKNPLRDELLLDHEFVLGKDGDLAVPLDKPGLGVTINMILSLNDQVITAILISTII